MNVPLALLPLRIIFLFRRRIGRGTTFEQCPLMPYQVGPHPFFVKIIMPNTRLYSTPVSSTVVPRPARTAVIRAVFGTLVAFSAPALAQDTENTVRWVSDDLTTYVRSGPTDGYRIVGALTSGDKVELIRTQGDYSQVRSESGNTVWIRSDDLQDSPGPAEALPQLEEQVAALTQELATIEESWQTRVQGMQETLESRGVLIEELEQTRQALHDELVATQSELRAAQAQLGDENKEVLMRYMMYGGGIAGAGLLVGLVLPSLMRSRKRNDGWV